MYLNGTEFHFFPLVHFVVPFVNTPEVSLVLLLCVLAAERFCASTYSRGSSGYVYSMVLYDIYII